MIVIQSLMLAGFFSPATVTPIPLAAPDVKVLPNNALSLLPVIVDPNFISTFLM